MTKKIKYLLLIIILILVNSCTRKPIIDGTLNIIIDHPLSSNSISDDKDLLKIISPYYLLDKKGEKQILISLESTLQRIDLNVPKIDSLKEEKNTISKISDWLTGGKKNDIKFKKNKEKFIEQYKLNDAFTSTTSDLTFVDTFLKSNNIDYLYYITDTIFIRKYKNMNLKVFSNIDSLQNYIGNNLNSNQSGKRIFNLFYKPNNNYTKVDSIKIDTSKKKIELTHEMTKKIPARVTETKPTIQEINLLGGISREIIDPKIKYCIKLTNDDDKLIYFFTNIFRYIKGTSYNSFEYKMLVNSIAEILISNFPSKKDLNDRFKTSYLIVCSNKTDFLNECGDINKSIELSKLKNIYFKQCPNN